MDRRLGGTEDGFGIVSMFSKLVCIVFEVIRDKKTHTNSLATLLPSNLLMSEPLLAGEFVEAFFGFWDENPMFVKRLDYVNRSCFLGKHSNRHIGGALEGADGARDGPYVVCEEHEHISFV